MIVISWCNRPKRHFAAVGRKCNRQVHCGHDVGIPTSPTWTLTTAPRRTTLPLPPFLSLSSSRIVHLCFFSNTPEKDSRQEGHPELLSFCTRTSQCSASMITTHQFMHEIPASGSKSVCFGKEVCIRLSSAGRVKQATLGGSIAEAEKDGNAKRPPRYGQEGSLPYGGHAALNFCHLYVTSATASSCCSRHCRSLSSILL